MTYEADPVCECCGQDFHVRPGHEATRWCHDCAQKLVPVLLEACEESISYFAGVDTTMAEDNLIDELGAAIAMAKGESRV